MSSAAEKEINVLFTSVGRRVELLQAFRRAYQALGRKGQIVALDVDPLAPALQVADRPYLVPQLDDPLFAPSLIKICQRESVGLVFPLTDWDIPVLARWRAQIEKTGARVAVVSPEAAALTSDKWKLVQFFRSLDLPTPGSWLPSDPDLTRARYPLFIKPRLGSAARDTYKVSNERELSFFLEYISQPIVQEFLPGPEITSDIICSLEGGVLGVVCRRRIEVRWGEVAKGVTVWNPQITEACIRIAEHLPAVGPITVQCILRENGQPCFTEINARWGGGVPLGIRAGADSPRWLLAKAAGLPVEIPPIGSYRSGLCLTRFDDSYFLSEDECERMQSCRV